MSDNIQKAVDEGHLVGVLYVELSKAFDTSSHAALLEKLKSFGITGHSHNWFTDYLFNRKQFCVVENSKSKLLNITYGRFWDHYCFWVFLMTLKNAWNACNPPNFADDTVVCSW